MNTTIVNAGTQSEAVEIGAMIRDAREALGYQLNDVAAQLHIRLVHLEAIEAGKFSDLPGAAYVSGFLRAYAGLLGLDSDEILSRLKSSGVNIGKQQKLDLLSPVEDGRLPTGPIFLLAIVIALATYGGWHYLYSTEKGSWRTSIISGSGPEDARYPSPGAVPDRTQDVSPGGSAPSVAEVGEKRDSETTPAPQVSPPAPVAAETGPAQIEGGPSPPPADASSPQAATTPESLAAADRTDGADAGEGEGSAAPPESAIAETRAPTPPASPAGASDAETGAAPAGGGEAARIVVRAVANSYVQVRDRNGNELYSGMMQVGDVYEAPLDGDLLLDTGNAGGLRLVVDGQEAPLLGSIGEVLRGISLDRGLLDR